MAVFEHHNPFFAVAGKMHHARPQRHGRLERVHGGGADLELDVNVRASCGFAQRLPEFVGLAL